MGKGTDEETSDVSDTTEGETPKEGEEESEDNQDENPAPAEEQPVDNGSGDGAGEFDEPEDEVEVTEEVENFANAGGEPMPLNASQSVTVQVGDSNASLVADQEDNAKFTATGTGAVVTFTGGLESNGGSIATNTDDLAFTVNAAEGYRLDYVHYTIDGGGYKVVDVAEDKMSAATMISNDDISGEVKITVAVFKVCTLDFDIAEDAYVWVSDGKVEKRITSKDTDKTFLLSDAYENAFQLSAGIDNVLLAEQYKGVKVEKNGTSVGTAGSNKDVSCTFDEIFDQSANEVTITVTTISRWSTLKITPENSEDVKVAFGETVNDDGYIEDEGDVTFTVSVLDSEKKIKAVTCVYGNAETPVTVTEDTYKIAWNDVKELDEGTVLTVKVELEDKKYEVTLPSGTSSGITWKYKGVGAATDFTETTSAAIEITSTDTITLQASVDESSTKKYSVTVGALSDQAKTVDKDHPAEWTITRASFEGDAESLDLSSSETDVTELVDITVTGSTTEAPFSVKYFMLEGDKTEEDALAENAVYTAAAENKIADVPVGTDIYLQITATGAAEGREVATATHATATYGEIGTVYLVTASATAENNTVAVTLDTAAAKKVNVTKDEHVASVKYAPDNGTADRTMPASGKINLPSSATQISIDIAAAANYEIAYVHKTKGTAHKDTGCEACVEGTDGKYTIDLAAGDAATEIEIATRKTMVEYSLAAAAGSALADINVTVEKADASGADPVSVSENNVTVGYKLGSGDTYYISADKKDANNALIKDVTISSEISGFKPVSGTNKYRFTADKAHTGDALTFTFTVNKKANKTVDFVTTNANLADASIKIDKYTRLKSDGTATEEVAAADFAAIAASYSVYEGTGFKFQLKAADNYKIKAVTCQVGTGAATTLDKGEDDFYALASVTDDTTITVTTEVDPASAFGIKINENPYVASATIDWTGAATPSTALVPGTAALSLTAGTDNKVNFNVTAKDGYTIEKVLDGTTEIPVVQGQTYYQVALTKGQTKEITVETKAAENTTDKFVKLIPYEYDNAVPDVKVTAPSGMEPVATDEEDGGKIYKLTGKKDTTPGIDEITVVATVEAGYTLDTDTVVSAGAILDSQKDGAYTFKISAGATALASATTEEAAADFTFRATKDMVTLKTVEGSNALASVKKYETVGGYGQSITVTTGGRQVDPGSMIVVTVNPGDNLFVNGEAVELKDNSWSGVVELGGGLKEEPDTYTFKAVSKEEYKVRYRITHGDDELATGMVDGSDIDVKYGDQVELSLAGADATAQIIKASVTSEGEAASTAQLVKDKVTKKTEKAVIDVKDAGSAFDVVLTVENDGTEYATTELAAITFQTKTTVTDVTVKGISKGKENKLDATSRMTYPLTVKAGKTVLNAADYADMLTAASADINVATADIVGGNLVIETKTTGSAVVTIKAVNQTGDDNLFSFTVAGQDPKKKLAVKSLASSAQGMNDLYLDMTPNTAIKEVSGAFDYYYEVNVAWKKGNDETAANHNTGYYYYRADVDDNKLQPLTKQIVVNKINAETNGDKCGNTYTFSTKMIAVKAGTVPADGQTASKDGEFASEKATVKDFSTRNKYYEDKLGVTKKTTKITSGQEDVLVAIPKFSAKASHIDDVNAKVCNTDGSEYTAYGNYDYITAYWDKTTNEIRMTAGQYTPAGKYNLVIEATAHQTDGGIYDMYRATATVPITVVGGVSSIDLTYPAQIAQPGSRDVSVTLKATGSAYRATGEFGQSSYKAASQKFTYELGSVANAKNKDQVVVKGSKVTVKKGFTVSADPEKNKFTVYAVAGDPVGYRSSVTIEVTDEVLVPTEIYLTKDGKKLGNNLTTLEADYADVVVKAGNRVINNNLLTITPAYNGKKTGYYSYDDELLVVGKGTLALKATTTDGGKKSVTRKDKYNITYPTNVTYSMSASNSNGAEFYEKSGKYQYSDTGNGVLTCYILADVPGIYEEDSAYTRYFNYSVSVKGGKIIDKDAAYGEYSILPNARETVVTVTDKANKNKKTLFTFVNLNYVDKKAPAATTKDKLYLAYDGYDEEYHDASISAQTLRYTLKDNKDGYNEVKFTAADSKSYNIVDINGTYTINEDNEFFVSWIYPKAVGTAKYNVVYGTRKNGIFYPATKAATLSVKVNKLGNMKPTVKYTINTVESLGTPLTYKPVDGVMYFDRVVSANVGGKKNKFYEFFEVNEYDELCIKTAQYEKLTAALKADPKNGNADFNPKEDLTGYLEYHYYTVNGRVDKSDKITVTVKTDQKVKYVASPVNVLAVSGVEATTSITLGKNPVRIASAKNVTEGWTATAVKDADGAATNQVKLTCTGTPEKGKVEFYVIPADSPKNTSTAYETDGILVSANVTVLKDDAATAKVIVNKKKNLTHNAEITATTVTLTAEAVQGSEFTLAAGGYAITKAEPVASTGETDLVAAAVKSVKMQEGVELPTIEIQLDRDKAIAAAKKDIITVPVKLTFDKGAVREQTISLNVKLQKVPEAGEVSALVKAELNDHELAASEISSRASAKAAMEAYAAENVEIDPMSGIVIDKIEAKADTEDKWGEGEGKSYAMVVTLKDVTAKADAAPIPGVDIVVKEKAAEVTVVTAAENAVEKIVVEKSPDATIAAAQFLLTETTTKDQVADWIETAVKKDAAYEEMKYVVVAISGWRVTPATESSTGSFYCYYRVVNSLTDDELASGSISRTFPQKTAAPTT